MKQFVNFLLFAVTIVVQFVVSYLLAFVTFIGLAELFNLGASATIPDPLWVSIVVYSLSAIAIGVGMLGVGWGASKLRKQTAPGLYHFLGAVVAGGLGWAWLQSTPMGQTRSPLVLIVAIFVGYYARDIVGMFSGDDNNA